MLYLKKNKGFSKIFTKSCIMMKIKKQNVLNFLFPQYMHYSLKLNNIYFSLNKKIKYL